MGKRNSIFPMVAVVLVVLMHVFIANAASYMRMWRLINDNIRRFSEIASLINIFFPVHMTGDFPPGERIGQFRQLIDQFFPYLGII